VTLAFGVVAIASLVGAGVLAAKSAFSGAAVETRVVERTYSCVALANAGARRVLIAGGVTTDRAPAGFGMQTWKDVSPGDGDAAYLQFAADTPGLKVDPAACRASKRKVAFASRGLIDNGVVTQSFLGGFSADCKVNGRVDVHVRLTTADELPTKALVAVANEKGGKPIGFLKWSPKSVATFFAASCTS
jgi:hypothetical protein